ncbi:MAG: hypothetical protein STSR0008_10030 [Ignavibacterium sp.]
MNKFFSIVFIFLVGLIINFYNLQPNKQDEQKNKIRKIFLTEDFSHIRDTLYTFDTVFVEINLKKQNAIIHFKSGRKKLMKISGGTTALEKGEKTKEGLFVIQSKMPKWHSRQFDNTLMLNWMGFNFGIGFHALLGNSYYNNLGKRNSSHGCVRLSREDAVDMYSLISLGTPVLVHQENNAIIVSFADSNDNYIHYSFSELKKILPDRLNSLYAGRYFLNIQDKLVIDKSNIFHSGLNIGDNSLIPKKQLLPIAFITDNLPESDNLNNHFFHNVKLDSSKINPTKNKKE